MCTTIDSDLNNVSTGETTLKIFTNQKLSQYDEKDGQKAYTAANSDVYDKTEVKQGSGGEYNGFRAGIGLTNELEDKAPHGIGQSKGVKIIG